MKSRLIASLALGVAVLVGTSGCALISPQATTIEYSAAEGVNIPDSGPLQVRNALIVANEDGTVGNLVAAIVNQTSDAQVLNIDLGPGVVSKSVRVPANSVVSLGSDDHEPLTLEDIDAVPGTDVQMSFQSGDADTVTTYVPVLDGQLSYLRPLAP
ncbi:DNA modification methylase [Microbacterium sp. P01]|uniref:DNA modification methylase n=1 Tax=unclassified Microbacterium TaxID=2609290 RepID=UPI00366DEF05